MKIKDYEFSFRELAGSMGDFSTLFPLAIGYIVVVGLNPAGFLIMMGLVNIITGLYYKLPMPLQPKKVIAATAIAQAWTPGMVYSTGFFLGILWLLLGFTNAIKKIVKLTPNCVAKGILVALGISLFIKGFEMFKASLVIGFVALLVIMLLKNNKKFPAMIILILFGLGIMAYKGQLKGILEFSFTLPPLTMISLKDMHKGVLLAGLAQIPLTLTNAVIVVTSLIREYFPKRAISEKKVLLGTGIINTVVPFFGGFPMCHGSGGLAGQYAFGARTGGANIMEGLIEISLGLFLAKSIVNLFSLFPLAITGAMLIFVAFNLALFAKNIKGKDLAIMALTVTASLAGNLAVGFIIGLVGYYGVEKLKSKRSIP